MTNMTEVQKKDKRIIAVTFLLTFGILVSIYVVLVNQSISNEKIRCSYIAANAADHFRMTVDCIMVRTNTLETLVQDHAGSVDFFDSVAPSIYDDVALETGIYLKNIAIAPQGVVSNVYPVKDNEALLGFDFMDLSKKGNAEAREAYLEGATVLTSPFELVQGGVGMAGRLPVLLRVHDEPELWGLVTVTIDFEKLVDRSIFKSFTGMGLDYALFCVDGTGESHVVSGIENIGEDAVKHRFTVRNLTWELAIQPKDGWSNPLQHAIAVVVFLFMSFFVAKYVDMFYELRSSRMVLKDLADQDK